jgi:hypothetical protein
MDKARSLVYFSKAAKMFGHYESIYYLGVMFSSGAGVRRDCHAGLVYMIHTSKEGGGWGGIIREGFNAYLDRHSTTAAILYMIGASHGYVYGSINAAFLLDSGSVSAISLALPYTLLPRWNIDHVIVTDSESRRHHERTILKHILASARRGT